MPPFPVEDALDLIVTLQQSPESACAYIGTDAAEIRTDLEELDQPWTDTARLRTAADGSVTGIALIEWDQETGRSWVHGPWTTPETWERDAATLLAEVIDQAPVHKHEIYADIAHTRMAALAEDAGWRRSEANYE
ncbi:MAG: GNAT family N-acetyltransferase, partial [Brachybacterium sp.]|nr:GNAT family N-acetyltransferase [Brachybacterium sp.]